MSVSTAACGRGVPSSVVVAIAGWLLDRWSSCSAPLVILAISRSACWASLSIGNLLHSSPQPTGGYRQAIPVGVCQRFAAASGLGRYQHDYRLVRQAAQHIHRRPTLVLAQWRAAIDARREQATQLQADRGHYIGRAATGPALEQHRAVCRLT